MKSSEPVHVSRNYGPPDNTKIGLDRTPPQNIELEMCVLGGIMLDPKHAYPIAEDFLHQESFYLDGHGLIFRIMGELFHRGTPPDADMVLDELRARKLLDQVGGAAVILSMLNSVPSAASVEYHAKKIQRKAMLRALIRSSTQIIEECYRQELSEEQIMEQAETSVMQLSAGLSGGEETSLNKELTAYWGDLAQRHNKREELLAAGQSLTELPTGTGIPCGITDQDNVTGGFRPSEVTILAARPSVGKTTLALNYLVNTAVRREIPVLMFSLEMRQRSLSERLLSRYSKHWLHHHIQGVAGRELEAAEVPTDHDWNVLQQAYNRLLSSNIFLCDKPSLTLPQLKSIARQHKLKYGIGLIIIDYLQLITPDSKAGKNREQEVSEISRGVKNLARELDVPVVLLSQLSREVAKSDRRPQLSDLRESGAIEQDADVVMFLHNPEYQKAKGTPQMCPSCSGVIVNGRCTKCRQLWTVEFELIIDKNRNGPCDTLKLAHIPAIYFFESGSLLKGTQS